MLRKSRKVSADGFFLEPDRDCTTPTSLPLRMLGNILSFDRMNPSIQDVGPFNDRGWDRVKIKRLRDYASIHDLLIVQPPIHSVCIRTGTYIGHETPSEENCIRSCKPTGVTVGDVLAKLDTMFKGRIWAYGEQDIEPREVGLQKLE